MSFAGIEGKAALVTGAASGIGASTVRRLAAEGARVVAVDRDVEGAGLVVKSLAGDHLAWGADVGSEEQMAAAVTAAVTAFGRIDLLHLNAGISGTGRPFDETVVQEFDEVIRVNLRGTYLGLLHGFRQLKAQGGGGSIVLTSSVAGLRGSPFLSAYSASKHAIIGLTRSAGVQGAPLGIRVNAVAPGMIETPMQSGAADDDHAPAAVRLTNPAGRVASPDEVAALVTFVLSDEAPFINGSVIAIDGGATADSPHKTVS